MILLYNPPSSANKKPVLPMSLLSLGALLEGRYEYRIVDGNLDPDPLSTLSQAVSDGARYLAVTVMPGPQLHDAVPLCKALKAKHPGLTIIWGGYFPTQHWEVCLKAPYLDFVVRGHNEQGFLNLIDALDKNQPYKDIPGLAWRHPLQLKSNPLPPVPNPNDFPDFPYHRVEVSAYARRTFMGRRTLPHHSSYGCPFLCNFCAVVNMVNGRWLAQSAARTAQVTRHLVTQYGADAVEFYDNNFFTAEARVAEFSDRILDLGIGWWGEGRIDTMLKYKDATWAKMRDAGLRMVFLGAESGSDETLLAMDKGGTASTQKTLEIAAKMKAYGVVPEMSFVLGNPPDPAADARKTIEFIRKVKRVNPATEVILYLYTPVPLSGTLYDEAKAAGFAFPETLEGWISSEWMEFSQRRSENLPWIDPQVQKNMMEFQTVLNAYFPTSTDPRLGLGRKWALKLASALRYQTQIYRYPYELKILQRLLPYQRPETSGF